MAGEVKEHGASTDLIFRWRLVRNARARAYQAQWLQCVPRRMDRISASTDVKWPPRRAGTQTNAPRPARTRSGATATELGAGFRGPPRNESTLRRAAFPSTFSTSPPARSVFLSVAGHERHLMKCHRCPTDRRAKCRRLPIPRLGEPSDFDFTRNAVKMTPQIPTGTLLSLPNPRSWNLISCRQCVCDSW